MANEIVSSGLVPWEDLSGKVVLVTGASSGIGRGLSLDLAKAGCRVIAAARRKDLLKSLCDEINQSYDQRNDVRAVAVELDVSAEGLAIKGYVDKALNAFGRIDVLINNAGVRGNLRNPLNLDEEEWNNTMRTNLTGTWLVSKYVGIHMRDTNQGGSIINISSISGVNRGDTRGGPAYAASKTGITSLTKVMALELGVYNIRVNCICPGLFMSDITKDLMKKEWINDVLQKVVPLVHTGETDPALTRLARYLIHDSSKYISGSVFIADAGLTLPGVPIFSRL